MNWIKRQDDKYYVCFLNETYILNVCRYYGLGVYKISQYKVDAKNAKNILIARFTISLDNARGWTRKQNEKDLSK